jgi:hypothetical protein
VGCVRVPQADATTYRARVSQVTNRLQFSLLVLSTERLSILIFIHMPNVMAELGEELIFVSGEPQLEDGEEGVNATEDGSLFDVGISKDGVQY